MSVFIQEVLGLLKRNKKKIVVDYGKDYFEFGRISQASIGNPGYVPKGEPFIIKSGDLKCQLLENVVLENGLTAQNYFPKFTTDSGSCLKQNVTITNSIMQEVAASSFNQPGVLIKGDLEAQNALLDSNVTLGTLDKLDIKTILYSPIADSTGTLAGSANRVLRSLADGRVVWTDDDPVVALPYGNIWLGDATGVQQPLPPGTQGQVIISDGTTLEYGDIAAWSDDPYLGIKVFLGQAPGAIEIGLDIEGQTDQTSVDGADELIIYHENLSKNMKVSLDNLQSSMNFVDGTGSQYSIPVWVDTDTLGISAILDDGATVKIENRNLSLKSNPVGNTIDFDHTNGHLKFNGSSAIIFKEGQPSVERLVIDGNTANAQITNKVDQFRVTQSADATFTIESTGTGALQIESSSGDIELTSNAGSIDLELGASNQAINLKTAQGLGISVEDTNGVGLYFEDDPVAKTIVDGFEVIKELHVTGSGSDGYLYITGNAATSNPDNSQGLAFAYNNSGGSRENEIFFNPGIVSAADNATFHLSFINEYLDINNNDARVSDTLLKLYGDGNLELTGPTATSTISNQYWRLPKVAAGNTGQAMLKSAGSIDLEWKHVNTFEDNVDGVPATATSAGTAGQIKFDENFIYVCYADNNWRRAALSTF